jgi:hypothetical protein
MRFLRVGEFYSNRMFLLGSLLLGVWLSFATIGYAQGEASIQGTVATHPAQWFQA